MTFSRSTTGPHSSRQPRRGIASIWVMVVLAILATLITTTTWQYLAGRRVLRDRHNRLQADWLARSGLELAAARLLAEPKELADDKVQLIPDARLAIQAKASPDMPQIFHVTSVAHYPTNVGPNVVVRSVERTFRRVADKKDVRLEVVAKGKGER